MENKRDASPHIVYSALITPDGTTLVSRHQHDYQSHKDILTDENYMIDGGHSYIRRSLNKVEGILITIYNSNSHFQIRNFMEWGTYGKEGDKPLSYIRLKDMAVDHIKAVLETQELPEWKRQIFKNELKYRIDESYNN